MSISRVTIFFGIVLLVTTIWIITTLPTHTTDPTGARMPLLAVSIDEDGIEQSGGIAYLNLRIVNGSGNVYIHSDPLTKIDTQASTTYAQRYACEYANIDCDRYDFLYSIESGAPIIGGPSAGAAAAAITYAVLTGQKIPQNTAVTGTISSGGIIGNVGGIPQKIKAAQREGLRQVIIPYLANHTPGDERITITRARSLSEVITGLGLDDDTIQNATIQVPPSYRDTMREVAEELCTPQETPQVFANGSALTAYERIENLTKSATDAQAVGDYYTQASHCFNIRVQRYYLQLYDATMNLSDDEAVNETMSTLEENLERARTIFERFDEQLENPDLNDIQIYSIVEERYRESTAVATALSEELERDRVSTAFRSRFDEDTLFSAAYALARIDSMESWMRFSGFEAGEMISDRSLRSACTRKLSAATEISEYTSYLTGISILDVSEIQESYREGEYAVCIYQASLLTARAEAFLSTIGISDDDLVQVYEAKRTAAYDAIAEQTQKGHFPVMAYSYYEYAQSLSEDNLQTALLYIENALSLAELDLYLEGAQHRTISFERDTRLAFAFGIFIMAGIGLVITAGSGTVRMRSRRLRRIGKRREG
jgi:uncharacterized protein